MTRRRRGFALIGIVVAAAATIGCQKDRGQSAVETEALTGDSTMVVATVGGESIILGEVDAVVRVWTESGIPEFEGQTPRALQRRALDNLVDQKLLFKAAQKNGHIPSEEQIDGAIGQFSSRFRSVGDFEKALSLQGITAADFRDRLRRDMAVRNYVMNTIPDTIMVTSVEAQQYFESHRETFMSSERIHARHILVKADAAAPETKEAARAKAQGLLEKVQGGADFAAVARESSDCPSSQQGGDLGTFGRGDMVKPFEDAAFSLKAGEVSGLVETQFGFHIIRIEEAFPAGPVPYNEALEKEITQKLLAERRNDAVRKHLDALREAASIDRKL